MFGRFSLKQINAIPTISEGHTDDLKLDDGVTRVWVSRMTIEVGADRDNEVVVERLVQGSWYVIDEYQPTDWSDYDADHPFLRDLDQKLLE